MSGFGASGVTAFYLGVLLGFDPLIALGSTLLMLLGRIAYVALIWAELDENEP